MEMVSFRAYIERFEAAACKHGARLEKVSNHACVASLGDPDTPRLAIMSGVHGDERSGPLGILKWLECLPPGRLVREKRGLVIVPLVNDRGWDANQREWNGVDLNRSFRSPTAPLFLREILARLVAACPRIFIDLHEDDDPRVPYVFSLSGEDDCLATRFAAALKIREVCWDWEPVWDGSSEVALRRTGCRHSITLEVPFVGPLAERIAWNIQAIEWCFNNL